MPRYVINWHTKAVHNADCHWAEANVVPWPRFESAAAVYAICCLPQGIPADRLDRLPFRFAPALVERAS